MVTLDFNSGFRSIKSKVTLPTFMTLPGILAAGVFSAACFLAATPVFAQNSCFNAQNCTSTTSEWSARESNRLNIRVRNNCSQGVSVRLCGLRQGQSEFCVFEWIRGGGTWNTYIYNASGRYAWREAGAARSAEAWSCTSRISNWNGPMRYN